MSFADLLWISQKLDGKPAVGPELYEFFLETTEKTPSQSFLQIHCRLPEENAFKHRSVLNFTRSLGYDQEFTDR